MNWHYSQKMPSGKLICYGVWEGGKFIGAVLYGRGGNNRLGSPYRLDQTEICELVRVALTAHHAPVSRILAYTLKSLRRDNPGLRLVVSYADPKQGHHGGIYQATNWVHSGSSDPQPELLVGGVFMHKRTASALYGTASCKKIKALIGKEVIRGKVEFKLTYLYPLDDAMRQQIQPLSKPYPKRTLGA